MFRFGFFQAALYIERKTVSARARSISASRSAARALKYLAARPRRNNWNVFAHSSMVLLANLGPAHPYLPAKVCVGPSIQSSARFLGQVRGGARLRGDASVL
jgi:hypothetical protein